MFFDNKLQSSVKYNSFIILSDICYMFRSYFGHIHALRYDMENQGGCSLKHVEDYEM
jgi:hypothetical protein